MSKVFGNSGQTCVDVWAVINNGKTKYFDTEDKAEAEVDYPIHIKVYGDDARATEWVNSTNNN